MTFCAPRSSISCSETVDTEEPSWGANAPSRDAETTTCCCDGAQRQMQIHAASLIRANSTSAVEAENPGALATSR